MADYRQIATQAAQTYGIPVDTFLSLLGAESSWNPNALSPKGAIGLGQLMPATAKELGVDPYDPEQNIYGSAKYLAQQFKRFGDPALAVAAYNAGPSAVAKYGGVPPYEETQNYVARVMGTQMADQMTPQQMAPQQAAGYQPFSPENLSRSQRTMLGFAALRDAAAALRGNQTSFFSDAYSGLEQQHRYGQELAFRQGQEQRLIDERAAAASQSAVASQLRAAEALAQVRQQLQWSPNDPTLLALEQSLMAQALGPSGVMPAAVAPVGAPAAAPAGVVPAAGAEPAAEPVSLPAAVTYANDPSKLDDAQLSAAMATLSASNDPRAVEALNVLRGEAATRAEAAASAEEKAGVEEAKVLKLTPRVGSALDFLSSEGAAQRIRDNIYKERMGLIPDNDFLAYRGTLLTIKAIQGMKSVEEARASGWTGAMTDTDIKIIMSTQGTLDENDPIGTLQTLNEMRTKLEAEGAEFKELTVDEILNLYR